MIIALSSPKPGSGTSTTAALLALAVCHDATTHLVDLCGDQGVVLGIPSQPGEVNQATAHLSLHELTDAAVDEQLAVIGRLAERGGHVVIDAGSASNTFLHRLPTGTIHCWVLRPCYLALRKAAAVPQRPDHIIRLNELGRSLTSTDIEAVTGVQVIATIEIHPQIARCVDAGLLTARPPQAPIAALAAIAGKPEAA